MDAKRKAEENDTSSETNKKMRISYGGKIPSAANHEALTPQASDTEGHRVPTKVEHKG